MQRRIEAALTRRGSLAELCGRWFATAATSRFLQRRADWDQLTLSLLHLRDAELALEAFFRLQAGECEFIQLAGWMAPADQARGCNLGPLHASQLHPLLEERLRTAAVGELLPPLELEPEQWVVLRLESRSAAQCTPALQAQLQQQLFRDWIEHEQQRLLLLDARPGMELILALPEVDQ